MRLVLFGLAIVVYILVLLPLAVLMWPLQRAGFWEWLDRYEDRLAHEKKP